MFLLSLASYNTDGQITLAVISSAIQLSQNEQGNRRQLTSPPGFYIARCRPPTSGNAPRVVIANNVKHRVAPPGEYVGN